MKHAIKCVVAMAADLYVSSGNVDQQTCGGGFGLATFANHGSLKQSTDGFCASRVRDTCSEKKRPIADEIAAWLECRVRFGKKNDRSHGPSIGFSSTDQRVDRADRVRVY